MIITGIKTKSDVSRVFALKEIRFSAAVEVSNEIEAKDAAAKVNTLLRQKKKLYLIIAERD